MIKHLLIIHDYVPINQPNHVVVFLDKGENLIKAPVFEEEKIKYQEMLASLHPLEAAGTEPDVIG